MTLYGNHGAMTVHVWDEREDGYDDSPVEPALCGDDDLGWALNEWPSIDSVFDCQDVCVSCAAVLARRHNLPLDRIGHASVRARIKRERHVAEEKAEADSQDVLDGIRDGIEEMRGKGFDREDLVVSATPDDAEALMGCGPPARCVSGSTIESVDGVPVVTDHSTNPETRVENVGSMGAASGSFTGSSATGRIRGLTSPPPQISFDWEPGDGPVEVSDIDFKDLYIGAGDGEDAADGED